MDKGQDMEEKKKWVSSLYMDRLRCNGMINPLGISGECLLFQWIGVVQEDCIKMSRRHGTGDFTASD